MGEILKLLVSVVNKAEALYSINGGADILDVKNPKEGSLGANFPRVIKEVKEVTPKNLELSATIGDLPNLPGTASLAALGAAVSGVDSTCTDSGGELSGGGSSSTSDGKSAGA